MKKIIKKILERKVLSGVIALFLVIGGYLGYGAIFSKDAVAQYALAQVQKGTLVVSIAGSGQVSVSNQVDIKPKVSGDVVYVGVKNGQEVKVGALIAQLDAGDAQKAVRDAEVNLESAKLSLEKLKKPSDNLSVLQAENSLAQAKESKQKAEDDLKKSYEDGFNTIANAMLDLPGVMAGLEDMMFDNTINPNSSGGDNIAWYVNQSNNQTSAREKAIRYHDDVYTAYNNARKVYEKNFDDYKATSRTADQAITEALILQTYDTTKVIADTVKTIDNYIDFVQYDMEKRDFNIPAMVSIHQTNISSYTSDTNSHLLNLLAIKRTIEDSKNTIANADRSIAEKTESLAKLKAGADTLDIQSSELTVRQRENALLDVKEKLADYFVRAPFAGIITNLDVEKGEGVSSATVIGTLVTKQKIAEASMNEIDIAKVKVGQKVTLAFDAILDLTINGQVAEMDTIGTVSQGVVTYNIKIGFDAHDERIKPGMSVSAEIVTDTKHDVLLVPNSAVKSPNENHYVEVIDSINPQIALTANVSAAALQSPPRRQHVEVGISNDDVIEITSGLKEGDIVVTRTVQGGQNSPAQTSGRPSLFGGGRR